MVMDFTTTYAPEASGVTAKRIIDRAGAMLNNSGVTAHFSESEMLSQLDAAQREVRRRLPREFTAADGLSFVEPTALTTGDDVLVLGESWLEPLAHRLAHESLAADDPDANKALAAYHLERFKP
jgi:hypothetical protein